MIKNHLQIHVKIKIILVRQGIKVLLCGSLPKCWQSENVISETRNSSVVQHVLL